MAHRDPAAAIAHLAARGPAGASTVRLDQQEAPRNRHQTAEATAGSGPPLHVHRDFAESFFVLAGRYGMHLDGRDFECPIGSFVYVPHGMRHTFETLDAGSRKLNLYTPAALVGYFDELAAGIAQGMDGARLDALADRLAMDVVGPIPEGYL